MPEGDCFVVGLKLGVYRGSEGVMCVCSCLPFGDEYDLRVSVYAGVEKTDAIINAAGEEVERVLVIPGDGERVEGVGGRFGTCLSYFCLCWRLCIHL